MTASELDLEDLEQGAYWRKVLYWTDESGNPIDLTGYTARMQIRRQVTDSSALIELTTENGRITLFDVQQGDPGEEFTILLEIDAVDMAELPATPTDRRWFYDLEMVPPDGKVIRLLNGRAIVSPEVTR